MLVGKLERLEPDRRYSIGETCELLNLSRKTLRKYTRAGDIKMTMHTPSGRMYYEGREINRFFNETI